MIAIDPIVAADLNLAGMLKHLARYDRGARVSDKDGLVMVAGSHPHPGPYRNAAFTDGTLPSGEAVARARAFFHGRSFVYWQPRHVNQSAPAGQLLEPDGLPELGCHAPPDLRPAPDGLRLVPVTERGQMRDFLRLNAAGWNMAGLPLDMARQTFFEPAMLEHPHVRAVIAYLGERPLSCAMTLLTGDAAGGYWAATPAAENRVWAEHLRAHQLPKQGLAELCARYVVAAAFAIGTRIAVCQASGSGVRIWERIGFQEITRYDRYLVTHFS